MQNRTPVSREARPPLPDFTPVPRQKVRHDGWTPERQRAFIEALADTGSVSRAAAMVNMAQTNCYTLRRAPGAEEFRRAWDAALDFGLARLKDIAFERAIDGQLVPVFVAGKLMGFSRKRNDALLMFCLRHYGRDANGRRTTINYFSTRASAGATGDGAAAEAATTTLRTVVTGDGADEDGGADRARLAAPAQVLEDFAGVPLDAEAQAAIHAAMAACAARYRNFQAALDAGGERAADAEEHDPDTPFIRLSATSDPYRGELLPPVELTDFEPFVPGEPGWDEVEDAVAAAPPPAIAEVRKRPSRRKGGNSSS